MDDEGMTADSVSHEDHFDPSIISSASHQRDGPALASPTMSRPESVASGRSSILSTMTVNIPSFVNTARPSPEYVSAASANYVASESMSQSRGSVSEDEDEPSDQHDRIAVAEGAVSLINAFLDKLLFDFLSAAKSTNLQALRPAIADVLKKSLARDAIAHAQDDVEDLLALQDSDEEEGQLSPSLAQQRWNVEFAWKRTRLRVMMRSENSDFDIDDDERYVQEEGLLQGRHFSQASFMALSAEIFLAGVLEFIAAQLLSMASIGATMRARRQGVSVKAHTGLTIAPHVLVQELDVEKAALNSSMERLWRIWRKSLRARGLGHQYRSTKSFNTSPTLIQGEHVLLEESNINSQIPDMEHPEHVIASNIPLPINARDIDEINTPWLARDPDEETDSSPVAERRTWHHPANNNSVLSYLTPLRSQPGYQGRPATSHHTTSTRLVDIPDTWQQRPVSSAGSLLPKPTPLVDAPGAWPAELPTQISSGDSDLDEAELPPVDVEYSPEKAEKLDKMEHGRPHNKASPSEEVSPHVESLQKDQALVSNPSAEVRASPIPTLDPSQVYAASRDDVDFPRSELLSATHLVRSEIAPSVSAQQSEPGNTTRAPMSHAEMAAAAALTAATERSVLAGQDSSLTFTGGSQSEISHDKSARKADAAPLNVKTNESAPKIARSGENDRYTTMGGPQYACKTTVTPTVLVKHEGAVVRPNDPESMTVVPAQGAELQSRAGTLIDVTSVIRSPSQPQQTLPPNSEQHVPKQPLRSRYSQDRRLNQASQVVLSPTDFLASRNLSPSSSPAPLFPVRVQPTQSHSTNKDESGTTQAATAGIKASGPLPAKESLQAPQGLVTSRQYEGDSRVSSKSQGLPSQSGPKDKPRERPSRPTGSDLASAETWVGTNKPSLDDHADDLENGAGKSALTRITSATTTSPLEMEDTFSKSSLTKLTSASIKSPLDFDTMVQRSDTIKYTLTPERAREPPTIATASPVQIVTRSRRANSKDSSRRAGSKDSSATKQSLPSIDTDTVGPRPSRVDSSSSVTSSPATASLPKDVSKLGTALSRKISAVNRPAPKNAKPTSGGHVAREPQVQTSSTLDFADFIRTTGPENGKGTPPPLNVRGVPSMRSMTANSTNAYVVSDGTMPLGGAKNTQATPSPQVGISSKSASNLQARGAQYSNTGISADLIELLRSDPPDQGSNRMSRTVSPYRNTMDSDATPASYTSVSPSVRSSMNSQVRLLPNSAVNTIPAATTQPAYAAPSTRVVTAPVEVPATTTERKRYRNKDPYYVGDSEDEDLLTALPKDRRAEESLMDFLRNNEPPANNSPRPLAVEGETQARAMLEQARASSVNNLRAATAGSTQPQVSSSASVKQISTPPKSPISAFPSIPPPRITSTLYPGSDQISKSKHPGPSYTTIASAQNRGPMLAQTTTTVISPGGVPRNPNRVRLQGRDAGHSGRSGAHEATGTGDLADFLRNSGPPGPFTPRSANVHGAPAPVLGRSEGTIDKKGGMRFWKRKTEV